MDIIASRKSAKWMLAVLEFVCMYTLQCAVQTYKAGKIHENNPKEDSVKALHCLNCHIVQLVSA